MICEDFYAEVREEVAEMERKFRERNLSAASDDC